MDGLLAQEYGNYPAGSEVMQNLMSPNMVVNQALDFIERRKQQDLRNQYNTMLLDKFRQTSPLEVEKLHDEVAGNKFRLDPRWQEGQVGTMEGQGLLQRMAGNRAKETNPARIEAETQGYKASGIESKMQNQLRSAIELSQNPELPDNMRAAGLQHAQALADAWARHDPSFLQKMWLQDDKLAALLEQIRTRAEVAPPKAEKPLTLSQMEAKYRDILARDPKNEEANAFLHELEGFKQRTAAGMADVTLQGGKLVSKREALGGQGSGPQVGTKENPIKLD